LPPINFKSDQKLLEVELQQQQWQQQQQQQQQQQWQQKSICEKFIRR
jgi:hypothetical protein